MANTKVYGEQIVDGSITAAKLADGTIVAAELANNAVETAAINADAVTGAKIADDAIDSEHYVDGSIDTAHIGNDQVTQAKIADDAVGADQLAASAVVTASIVDDNVTTAKIADGNISTALLADNAVTSAKLANNIDIAGTFDVTGATVLDSTLSVAGISTLNVSAIIKSAGTNDTPADLSLWHTDGSIVSGDDIAVISAEGSDSGGSAPYQGAKISFDADANWDTGTSNYYPTNINFFTQDNSGTDTIAAGSRLTIQSDGNVGIGTASPQETLHLFNSAQTWNQYSNIRMSTESDSYAAEIGFHRGTSNDNDRGLFLSGDGSTKHVRVLHGGNVGIGTTSPDAKLHIEGNSDTSDEDCMIVVEDLDTTAGSQVPAILFKGNGSTIGRMRVNDSLGFMFSGGSTMSDDLVVKNGPLVGIGTNSPAAKFHVAGTSDDQIILDSNSSTANTGVFFRENGSNKWEVYHRGATNDFRLYNYATSAADVLVSAAGHVTQPAQPVAIYTHSTNTEAGAYQYVFGGTGATQVTCKPQGEVVNRGSMYDTSNGRFTAPVAGIYRYAIHGNLYTQGLHANAYWTYRIYKNGGHYLYHYESNSTRAANAWVYFNASGLILLAKDDYLQFELKTNNLLSDNFGMDLANYTHYEFALLY